MDKLLIICGPTATGKTKLALELAKQCNGEILSADSRQVYRYMDIVTGKDIPIKFKVQSSKFKVFNKEKIIQYYTNGKIRIWGLDVVNPDEEFSVNHFVRYAKPIINNIVRREKLPIIVGGTGLYIKALLEPFSTIHVPPNQKLRQELEKLTTVQLQTKLQALNPDRIQQMNNSDKNNPRRLVRAIEVTMHDLKYPNNTFIPKKTEKYRENILMVCLAAPKEILMERINTRVDDRVTRGALQEVQNLLAKGYGWDLTAMSGLGYKQFSIFNFQFSNNQQLNNIISLWKKSEYQYAKRQLTWFKKQKDVHWFDVSKNGWAKDVVDLVQRWYNENKLKTHL